MTAIRNLLVALTLCAAIPVSAATQKTLFKFPSNGNKGCYPVGSLLRDDAGALYGATYFCGSGGYGTVYKLTPPAPGQSNWSFLSFAPSMAGISVAASMAVS